MKRVVYTCDKCGKEIPDVVYTLSCMASVVDGINPAKYVAELCVQNGPTNKMLQEGARHLCKSCKDKITDGVFIL